MLTNISMVSISHIGNSRGNQEDNFLLYPGGFLPPDVRDEMAVSRRTYGLSHRPTSDRFLVAVSDGMGGHASGEVASGLTVQYLSDHYEQLITAASLSPDAVAEGISRLDEYVCQQSRTNSAYRGMGATLCGVICNGSTLLGFNVGDSRLYRLARGRLTQVSRDHTEGCRLLSMGLLTEQEVQTFPRRKALYRYIGSGVPMSADVFPIDDAWGGCQLLLCSDGLTDVVSHQELEQIMLSKEALAEKGNRLVNLALSRAHGRGDNITVVLVDLG